MAVVLGDSCSRWQCPGDICPGWQLLCVAVVRMAVVLGGDCPRWKLS